MSVCNLILRDHDVRLVSDTVSYAGKQPVEFNRKAHVFPEARFALTVHGYRWLAGWTSMEAVAWNDFTEAVEGVQGLMEVFPHAGSNLPMGDYEVTLAGWQNGRARAVRLIYRRADNMIEAMTFEPGVHLAPSLGKQDIPPDLDDEHLVKIAMIQQQVSRKRGLQMCIGGDVELTTINKAGAETRVVGEYADKGLHT